MTFLFMISVHDDVLWMSLNSVKRVETSAKNISKNAENVGLSGIDTPKRKETRYDAIGVIINVYTEYSKLQLQAPACIQWYTQDYSPTLKFKEKLKVAEVG